MRHLVAYFRSGWAFLLPYLFLYLAYAWQKWPLGPGGSGGQPPALLHVFWVLHALHLALGAATLCWWWRQPATARPAAWPWIPWLCLAVLLWLPGAYLEFPADPWEHYGRMNRWKDLIVAGSEATWYYKAGYYFLAYSFLGRLPVLAQQAGLDVFCAAVSLLLSWQYYRLARACGLPARPAMVFTLLQTLLFGNDLFGFYRYYAPSSSVFAQLGAVAAIKIAISLSQGWRPQGPPLPAANALAAGLGLVLAAAFAAANHAQGLAIAALGIFAVLLWHLAKCGRAIFLAVLGVLVVASVVSALFWPRHALIDSLYKSSGWLNAWNGFDLFSPGSGAWRRMVLILGLAGGFNLAAAAVLLRWNHIAGWLTITPVIALQLAFISIPFANLLAKAGPGGIVTFHRLFFAIPAGLALVALAHRLLTQGAQLPTSPEPSPPNTPVRAAVPFAVVLLACAGLAVIPAGYPHGNRFWNAWVRVPADLRMTQTLVNFHSGASRTPAVAPAKPLIIATAAISNVLQAYAPYDSLFITEERLLHSPVPRSPAADQMRIQHFLSTHPASGRPFVVVPADPLLMFTPQSQAALLSRHWNPSEAALGQVR